MYHFRRATIVITLFLCILIALTSSALAASPAQEQTTPPTTLRVYGMGNEGAGDPGATDPATGLAPEDPPYTGVDGWNSIFDPQGPQAPQNGSVTWNPVWMYENETFDENQMLGLYHELVADDINISEKVWHRMWYEPAHRDKDGIVYPAIMQEYTYTLMEPDKLGNSPDPITGPAGRTRLVFPVGVAQQYIHNPFGYGLTSLDGTFDCIPDIVEIDSERTLAEMKTGVDADFNGNGALDPLDADGVPLSGDELVVLSLQPQELRIGGKLQFLDHMLEVIEVTNNGVKVRVWYMGDLQPVNLGDQTIGVKELWSYKTRFPGIEAPRPETMDLGAFFIHVVKVDMTDMLVQIRLGRALGATYANVEAGEPNSSLKRFYVDGHQYNVVAIGTGGTEDFLFITIRTPVPKENVTIPQHSVRLQSYDFKTWLPMLPPYNYEHYIVKDVQPTQGGRLIGDLAGPVAPILQDPGMLPYLGACPPDYDPYYDDQEEMRFTYVKEETNAQFRGELLEVYREDGDQESWDAQRWQVEPDAFTEFVLPDIKNVDDLYLYVSAFSAPASNDHRVKFWFDPAGSSAKYKSPYWLRVYGAGSEGPGAATVQDPLQPDYPVEVWPYTDPEAPFDPLSSQAPPNDSVTFNPALMSEFLSDPDDPLRAKLYPRIAIDAHDAMEKVFFRMWYEPVFLDKILRQDEYYSYPALVQEFTYMYLDTAVQPGYAQPGWSNFAFPTSTRWNELWDPFGFGLTNFDADFDGKDDDVVTVHSEESLADYTGIWADFDGDGALDPLDSDGIMNGDELVVFAVDEVNLSYKSPYAMFLDHIVELVNVTPNGLVQLQIWNAGGGLQRTADGYSIAPFQVGAALPYEVGGMGIVGRNKVNVQVIPPGGNNLGQVDGGWFVYVKDINTETEIASLVIGRALGATHSAIDNGAGRHDLTPGDPWYLKRFFVDGHEYNVVAIRTHTLADGRLGFKYITIRTPVPKVNFDNAQDSQRLQGYPVGSIISVMPPFNIKHTIVEDILKTGIGAIDNIGDFILRPPMKIGIVEETSEPSFTGELKEVLNEQSWTTQPFNTLPDQFTALNLISGETYLLTSSWLDANTTRVQFWYDPGADEDHFVNPPYDKADVPMFDPMPMPTSPTGHPPADDHGMAPMQGTMAMATVTSAGLNLRSGPGNRFAIYRALTRGTTMAVLGQNEDGSWLMVRLADGAEGWLARRYTNYGR